MISRRSGVVTAVSLAALAVVAFLSLGGAASHSYKETSFEPEAMILPRAGADPLGVSRRLKTTGRVGRAGPRRPLARRGAFSGRPCRSRPRPDAGRLRRLVQSTAVPKPESSLSAVIVSGGKQYRVAPGDRILVDRLSAEPGSSLKLDRILLLHHGDEIKVGSPAIDGLDVEVKVLAHRRGPRLESLRYKSKKRVRVHHGGRADLTALEIIAIGGMTGDRKTEPEAKPAGKAKAKARPKAEPKKKVAASAELETPVEPKTHEKPAKRAARKKETT